MRVHGSTWDCIGVRRSLGGYVGVFGSAWEYLRVHVSTFMVYGSKWEFMGVLGSTGECMRVH